MTAEAEHSAIFPVARLLSPVAISNAANFAAAAPTGRPRWDTQFIVISRRLHQDFIFVRHLLSVMNKKHLLPVLLVPCCILAIPAGAMLLKVEGWAWSPFDFVLMWVILTGAVGGYQFLASKAPNAAYRLAAALAVLAAILLFWINGAVGLIGSEDNPANLLYGIVLAIGVIGSALARLRPLGMARALGATAIAQLFIPLAALWVRPADFSPGLWPVLGLNFCFVLLFASSAVLFKRSGNDKARSGAPITA